MELPWYINEYLHTSVPLWMMAGIVIAMGTALCLWWRWRCWILLTGYVAFVVCHTLVFRVPFEGMRFEMIPFWNYREMFVEGNLEDVGEVIMNIALFVPVGVFGACCMKWCRAVGVGFALSFGIEMMQLVLSRGFCETNDVIHNTLGAAVGAGFVYVIRKCGGNNDSAPPH